jgi:hypothetical protein
VSCEYRGLGSFPRIWLSTIVSTSPGGVLARFKGNAIPAHPVLISGHAGFYSPGGSGSGAELLVQVGRATLTIKPYPTAAPASGSPATNGGQAPAEYEEVAKAVAVRLLDELG